MQVGDYAPHRSHDRHRRLFRSSRAMTESMKGTANMPKFTARLRFIVGAMALALIVAVAAPAGAQQRNPDSSVNPTASSVKEDQLLNELNRISGSCSLPDQKACTI